MSYQKGRDEFMILAHQSGLDASTARRVLALAATLQRLAVAQLNGDYPCSNGVRPVEQCASCGANYAPESLSKAGVCPECRAQKRLRELLAPTGVKPMIDTDPRGGAVKLQVPSGTTNDWGQTGICVPVRKR